jgi:hypothetical protein
MRLKCISHYRSPGFEALPGQELVGLSEARARFLLADSPGSFVDLDATPVEEPVTEKALDKPPADKMVRAPARRK